MRILRLAMLTALLHDSPAGANDYGLVHKPVFDHSNLPVTEVSGTPYGFERIVQDLDLPTAGQVPPGRDDVVWIMTNAAILIQVSLSNPQDRTVVLDISDHAAPMADGGALNFVFHPRFGQSFGEFDYIYVFYTVRLEHVPGARVSRFSYTPGFGIDPSSEIILLQQDRNAIGHWGGGLEFGHDGYLYIGLGDNTQYSESQNISSGFLSGILRIDVDRDLINGNFSPIMRPPWGYSNYYLIPKDNPFVGLPLALEEFYALGLRNPYRMSRDPVTNEIWIADVGESQREEINILRPGANYEWNYKEGHVDIGEMPVQLLGQPTEPIFTYSHSGVDNCIIGGFVYRGNKFPELYGKYLFADNGSSTAYAYDPRSGLKEKLFWYEKPGRSGIVSLFTDVMGDIYFVILGLPWGARNGEILRLIRHQISEGFPELLSQTGVFNSLEDLDPNANLLGYDVIAPLWSDNTTKRRWIGLTDETIGFSEAEIWNFPTGTVFVKHFEIATDENNPATTRKLETRLMVVNESGSANFATYMWNDSNNDASLLLDGAALDIEIINQDGSTRTQHYVVPSVSECALCHNGSTGTVLGVTTAQLNFDHMFVETGHLDNQIRAWNHVGIFDRFLNESEIYGFDRHSALMDTSANLEARVRSYLDGNCSHCHNPELVHGLFDARATTPLESAGIINGPLLNGYGIPGARVVSPGNLDHSILFTRLGSQEPGKAMPPIGREVLHEEAILVFEQWIAGLANEAKKRAPRKGEHDSE